MKSTQILTFAKTVSTPTASTEAIVTVEFGKNFKGEDYRNIDQVNTANETIDNARDSFEEGQISLEEMVSIIESQGFVKK